MNLPAEPSKIVSPTLMLSGREAREYAQDLAKSDLLTGYFQGSVDNILFAMELGKTYKLEPAALLQNIHVFETWKDGVKSLKATLSANLMVHLARNAGHIVATKANSNKATCSIIRGDTIFAKMVRGDIDSADLAHYSNILSTLKEMDIDPKAFAVTESVWTMEKAETAGLVKEKGNWVKYPHAMLPARAKADCVRLSCEEVLIGINDHAERIGGGFVDRNGNQISTSWTHIADELGGSINDETGAYVPLDRDRREPQQESPQRASITARSVPADRTREDEAAKADLAAQAGSDPSKAGWGKDQEKPKAPSMADNVRAYVEKNTADDVIKLLGQTLSEGNLTDADRLDRTKMIMGPLAERYPEKIFPALEKILAAKPDFISDALLAVADHASANTIADVLQDISLMDNSTRALHLIEQAYGHLKTLQKLDSPASFFDRTAGQERNVKLGAAVKILVQPHIKTIS